MRKILVLGASGFVGRRLIPHLVARGFAVRAGSRSGVEIAGAEAVRCDLESRRSLECALAGCDSAVFLVHGLLRGGDFPSWERSGARRFAHVAAGYGLTRVVYLGGLAPQGEPSRHLASRLAVGEILRQGKVGCIELRASLLIGEGGASWQIARDLALRLPALPVAPFARARTEPLDVDDAVGALASALDSRIAAPAVLDLAGPEALSIADFVLRIAARAGRHLRSFDAPRLGVDLAALGIRALCRVDFKLTRELLLGIAHDVVARDRQAFARLGLPPPIELDRAIDRALAARVR